MSITPSFEGIGRFLQANDGLIKNIRDTVSTASDILEQLADRVQVNRDAASELIDKINTIPFITAKDSGTKAQQGRLLTEIEDTRQKIHLHRDDPTMMGLFETHLAALY